MTKDEFWKVMRFVIAFTLFFLVAVIAKQAKAHEDADDEGAVTQFDPWCCSNADCKRVANEDLLGQSDGSIVHVPTGRVFPKANFRNSTNKHQYACIYRGEARCLYLRGGV